MLDHVMKVLQIVLEVKVRNRAEIDDKQFGFRQIRGATDAVVFIRQKSEQFWLRKGSCGSLLWI